MKELDDEPDWRKVFSDDCVYQARRSDARRAAGLVRSYIGNVRFGDDGTPMDPTVAREISVSIYGVELGIKPLYHEQFNRDAAQVAEVLSKAVSKEVIVREEAGHVYAYREDSVARVLNENPFAYPGDSLFDRIHRASLGDYNGDLLGFGAMRREDGDFIILIFDLTKSPNTDPLTGFHTRNAAKQDRAEMFERLWEDFECKPVRVEVRPK